MNTILLVYPKPNKKKNVRFGFSLNLLYISSILKNRGYNIYFKDFSCEDYEPQKLYEIIEKNDIKIVIVELDSFELKRSLNRNHGNEILKSLKVNFKDLKTIAYGYDCILTKDKVIYADVTIMGDPLKSIESAVENLLNDKSGYIEKNYNLDQLPLPDRELLNYINFYRQNNTSTLIETSRGCLNSCTFCQRRGWQNKYEVHSIEYIKREFSTLKEEGYRNIWIKDENFSFDLNRSKNILRMLIKEQLTTNMKIAISSWTKIDKEFIELANKANITVISFGIESANEEILKFYNKNINLKDTLELIDYADSLGIFTIGNFILGAPMETEKTILKTFNYIENSKLDRVNIKILDYMIGSIIYEQDKDIYNEGHYFACKENGLNQFSLQYLKQRKTNFIKIYNKQRECRLKEKINIYGFPYYI